MSGNLSCYNKYWCSYLVDACQTIRDGASQMLIVVWIQIVGKRLENGFQVQVPTSILAKCQLGYGVSNLQMQN